MTRDKEMKISVNFLILFYNCKDLNEFTKFLANPESIIDTKQNYQKEIKELNLKFNKFSLDQKSIDKYIDKLKSIIN